MGEYEILDISWHLRPLDAIWIIKYTFEDSLFLLGILSLLSLRLFSVGEVRMCLDGLVRHDDSKRQADLATGISRTVDLGILSSSSTCPLQLPQLNQDGDDERWARARRSRRHELDRHHRRGRHS